MNECCNCGNKATILKVMSFDMNEDFYLQCDSCGVELLDEKKIILHIIILVILGVVIAKGVIYYDGNLYLLILGILLVITYHIVCIPFRKC